MSERVLCVNETALDLLRPCGGGRTMRAADVIRLASLPYPTAFVVRDRPEVESDESVKQLATYIIVRRYRYGVLSYIRPVRSGEVRLHGRRSIGIGGHVRAPTPLDAHAMQYSACSVYSYLWAEAVRELREELGVDQWSLIELVPEGLIYDASDAVGRVHLGLCFSAYLEDEGELQIDPDSLADAGFRGLGDVLHGRRDDHESWSRIAIDEVLSR